LPGASGHAYNPGYSRGRDQEDHNLKPIQANSSLGYLKKKKKKKKKKPKRVAQVVSPEFKLQY
jgi:hypothetical protein